MADEPPAEEPAAEADAEQAEEAPAEPPVEPPTEEPPGEEPIPEEPAPEEPPVEEPADEPAEGPAEAGTEEEAPPPIETPPADEKSPVEGVEEGEEEGFISEYVEEEQTEIDEVPSPEEEKRLSQIYAQLTLKIISQNKVLNELKEKVKQRCMKYPRTACEEREICNLKICMEQENLKLQCLVKNAMTIQSKDPDRKWPPIPVETTFDEDCMPLRVNYNAMTTCFGPLKGDGGQKLTRKWEDVRCTSTETTSQSTTDDSCMKMSKSAHGKQKKRGGQFSKELSRSYSMQEKLVADNADLEGDRYKLQEELLSRDRMIECLQQKVCLMHAELTKLCRQTHGGNKKDRKAYLDEIPKLQSRLKDQDSTTKLLANAMDRIQSALDCLKLEVDAVKKYKDRSSQPAEKDTKSGKSRSGKNELQNLKQKYCELLEDYASKERELSELKEKVDAFIEGRQLNSSKGDAGQEAEVRLLRQKLKETREEQEEFKVIICEQSKQTEEYREKYMSSLQKIEELKCILQKMEVDNKRIEDQINLEIQRIKDKFQEKLQDWAHLPQMLENEQVKLAQCCKEKDEMESKLRIVCRELKTLKAQKSLDTGEKDDPDKLHRLEEELADLRTQYDMLLECKNRLCEKYEQVKKELDVLRQESAKIICRLKERAQSNQATLQKHIDDLEHDLAQCRATASLSIADREEVIKDMQSQLNVLALSFDSAQKQIKSLKDHICYLSRGKANSVVIALQNQQV